jgi:hypothetical protein
MKQVMLGICLELKRPTDVANAGSWTERQNADTFVE